MQKCDKCGRNYNIELTIPDFIWERIKGKEEYINLCSICITTKMEEVFNDIKELKENPDWILIVKKVAAYWLDIDKKIETFTNST